MADPQINRREEIALEEVGHTDVSYATACCLVAAFLAVILLVPLLQIAAELQMDRTNRIVLTALELLPNCAELSEVTRASSATDAFRKLAGVNMRIQRDLSGFDDRLSEQAEISRFLIPKLQTVLTGWLGAGTEQAYVGRDGWLFFRPALDFLSGRGFLDETLLRERARSGGEWESRVQPDPLPAILEFRDQLSARGIELILMPMPTKAAIYPERFSDRYSADAQVVRNPSWDEFTARLSDAGVMLFDAAALLHAAKATDARPLYLETDTHWTPHAMALVAQELAGFIESRVALPPVSKPGYEREQRFVENVGDVAVMLSPIRGTEGGAEAPAPTSLYGSELRSPASLAAKQRVAIERIQSVRGEPWQPNRGGDVLLLGDSYANIFSMPALGWGESAGLAEHLSAELGRPLDAIRINDNGSHLSRQTLSRELRSGSDRLAGKRVVIWEFTERELAVGDWKTGLSLALAGGTGASISAAPAKIRGRVAKLSRPPRPGTVPYRDCVVALHLTQVGALDPSAEPAEALIFLWGMRDNVWTPAAELRVGHEIVLEARPWRSVETRYGSYNRIELDDDALLLLEPHWADSFEVVDADAASEGERDAVRSAAAAKAARSQPLDGFRAALAQRAAELEAGGQTTLRGQNGWLFFRPELRSLSLGPFWGEHATRVSRSAKPEHADPLAAILDFHTQLGRAGVELLLVPVPAKAAIHSSELPESLAPPATATATELRIDAAHQQFFALLAEAGVEVLDPSDEMLRQLAAGSAPMYCKQDTHWSPLACEITARLIADAIRDRAWLRELKREDYAVQRRDVEITGDLWLELGDASLAKESVSLSVVGTTRDGAHRPLQPWRESPVLLLGDSHNLVFHSGGDMHARGAGLADQLARELGFPVDLLAVRGSGANAARISLLRRRDDLAGKKLVVWVFGARELTESEDGWRKIPVIR